MKKRVRFFLKILVVLIWILIFYLQFERPFIARLIHHISPSLLLSSIPHAILRLIWLSAPLIIFAVIKGRAFCWNVCPVGLIQDIIPSIGKTRHTKVNLYLFLVLFSASFFLLNLIALFDPIVTFNRALISLKLELGEFIIFIIPVIVIFLLNIYQKRFWCFKLCPLGALLDWISRLRGKTKFDIDKRKTIIALGLGIFLGWILKSINLWPKELNKRLLRPPGALPENEFTDNCIRCGSCIGVCLTGTLTPAILEGGIEGIFTPRLVPQTAECDENCNKCCQACPTNAIRHLTLDQKKNFKIGTASIDHSRCIAWSKDALCLVCQEFCPYLAIDTVKNKNGIPSPKEIPEKCRGCGLCEKNCPARPIRAIKVFNSGAGEIIST